MAYKVIILYQLYMPSYFLGTFTEYPYEKKHSGRIVVTDSLLNPIDHPMSPQLLKEVLEYKNRFRKKD